MLRELLLERRSAVAARWLDALFAGYGEETSARWRRERDPFANPVGGAFAAALPVIVAAVAGGGDAPAAEADAALEAVVRIRCVQDLAPSAAVGFVYGLRAAIREGLADALAGGARAEELAALDGRIEQLALRAFDVYVRLREQVYRLRQEELKRSVASLLRRWHGDELPAAASAELVRLSPPPPSRNGAR